MSVPKVSLRMRTDAGEREGELIATAGTTIEVELEDIGAGVGVDYSEKDTLRLRLEGRLRMRVLGSSADLRGSVSKDLFNDEVAVHGALDLAIDKDVSASFNTTVSPDEKMVGATLKITF